MLCPTPSPRSMADADGHEMTALKLDSSKPGEPLHVKSLGVPYCIILYYTLLYYKMLCYVVLCYVMLHFILSYHITSCHVISYHMI